MRYLTAGESHGKALMGILEGIPANLQIDFGFVDAELKRRQGGYGRGGRMAIESDKADFIAGIRGGVTTGAPIGFLVHNKDYENWQDIIGAEATKTDERKLTAVRPGHADLGGCIKYNQKDARNILERASARETAARVVIGAVCKQYLSQLGVTISGKVLTVGGESQRENQREKINQALSTGDTLGGTLEVRAKGVPIGIGSHIASEQRLEYSLFALLAAIPAVKSVSVGNVEAYTTQFGSETHDALYLDKSKNIIRKTNNAGGIEGGISNGEDIIFTLGLKPIPSVPSGLPSVDIETKKEARSAIERGDACVVEAASVVAEAALAIGLAQAMMDTIGGDYMDEVKQRVKQKRESAKLW